MNYQIITNKPLPGRIPDSVFNTVLDEFGEKQYIYQGKSPDAVPDLDLFQGYRKVGEIKPYDKPLDFLSGESDPLSLIPRVGWSIQYTKPSAWRPLDINKAGQSEKKNLDCILPGLMRGSVGTLVSAGGTGKSLAVMQIGAMLTLGKPNYLTPKGIPRTVAYLSLEDPEDAISNRLHDLYWQLNPTAEEQIRLSNHFLPGECRGLIVADKSGTNPDVVIDLFRDTQKPDLVVLDTARRAHHLDENSSGDMSLLIDTLEAAAEALDCAILILHHTSKGAAFASARGEDMGSGASRGSSVLVDNARAVWSMRKMSKAEAGDLGVTEEERGAHVLLTQEKINLEKGEAPKWLKRTDRGYFQTVTVTEKSYEPGNQTKNQPRKGVFA